MSCHHPVKGMFPWHPPHHWYHLWRIVSETNLQPCHWTPVCQFFESPNRPKKIPRFWSQASYCSTLEVGHFIQQLGGRDPGTARSPGMKIGFFPMGDPYKPSLVHCYWVGGVDPRCTTWIMSLYLNDPLPPKKNKPMEKFDPKPSRFEAADS